MTFKGQTIPVSVNLSIDAGANPNSVLRLGDGSKGVDIHLSYAELYALLQGCRNDPRFGLATAAATGDQLKAARDAMKKAKEDMENFAKGFGL